MTMQKNRFLMMLALLFAAPVHAADKDGTTFLTLDQAVRNVQQDTGGTILSAERRGEGKALRYFIRVLTPEGHVKRLVVSAESGKNSASTQPTKNPPAKRPGS